MVFTHLRFLPTNARYNLFSNGNRFHLWSAIQMQTSKSIELNTNALQKKVLSEEIAPTSNIITSDICSSSRVVPMVLSKKENIVLPFDDVPGPKSLKYLAMFRNYLSEIGTQITAGFLTFTVNAGALFTNRKSYWNLSTLFDEYGPVVRFVSPVGSDIVLINHPDLIQKVFSLEGDCPVRSNLESLERYRTEHKNHAYGGLYTVHGQEWARQRSIMNPKTKELLSHHVHGLYDITEKFTQKIYNVRNYQDEMSKDLYKELHKWAFDSMGLITFAKNFCLLDTELIYNQCDASWMYHSLEHATDAIIKCETGLHFWKFFTTPAWYTLVKYCDNLDSLIGKFVLEIENDICTKSQQENISPNSLTSAMVLNDEKFKTEDIATILMDMLLIGVNTISSSISFLLYNIAKHQKAQKQLYQEVGNLYKDNMTVDINNLKKNTPYLQACIKESLRLVPPIPLLTRVLSKNITLDQYNIPRGTLIIMSTKDCSMKESNFDEADKFMPERWLREDAKDYHAFASIPFGFGARRCIGQNIAETMISLITIKVLQKFKLEYHYGDIQATKSFIAKPNKPLKIRFVDRI
ncbi:1,25-dihydroxyvitamin D(3) 24-hydroxylase, mitochondrial-like [Danaus plexippus]|uniref:1,25-dihydroxyvitamin D(3) 24-hydroxylase, mitochondrial-like n=1 Tax=Danaus plexippus TaxID=13037 RepID=UPI002AAFDBDB|nr:1,25-dihydroxyvitamin D(3) 24-hydroxylase, mitochondrial-like [Danaus plexippus]